VSPADQISQHISELPQWQADFLSAFRRIINATDPDIVEAWKWSTPVYMHDGLVCATGVFKDHVKCNFFKGALLPDQSHFNAGLESKQSRAIDFKLGDTIDESVLTKLIQAAVMFNQN
jgi:hypothetical protein